MCGIIGYIGDPREGQWGETHRLLEALLLAAEHRGKDATGFVAATEPYKDPLKRQVIVEKQPMRASRFVERNAAWRRLRHQRCSMVLCHVRWATHGDPANNENNHPHVCRNGRFHCVHNGVVHNHRTLARRRSLPLFSECDSEVILRLTERLSDGMVGLSEALRLLDGSIAAVIYDARQDLLWIGRNDGRPFWLMRLNDRPCWFFGSTRAILVEAMREVYDEQYSLHVDMIFPVAPDHVHALSARGEIIAGDEVERVFGH